jgi:hypothetical protein
MLFEKMSEDERRRHPRDHEALLGCGASKETLTQIASLLLDAEARDPSDASAVPAAALRTERRKSENPWLY